MNSFLRVLMLFVLWVAMAFTGIKVASHSKHKIRFAEPTEGEQEGTSRQKQRQAWMEGMHRISPGMSWQAIDQQTRMQRLAHSRAIDTLAGGNINGFWKETGSVNQA